MTQVWDEPPGRPFSVVLTAGRSHDFGAEDLDAALDWEAAVVATASAVLERGGSIVVPANAELAHLVAAVAMPYAQPHAAERSRDVAPVLVVETGGVSPTSRRELAPFAHRNAITYHARMAGSLTYRLCRPPPTRGCSCQPRRSTTRSPRT
jgi:hypothetical protein